MKGKGRRRRRRRKEEEEENSLPHLNETICGREVERAKDRERDIYNHLPIPL